METKIVVYHIMPKEAAKIREEVFIREQGFDCEFDETDGKATHLLLAVEGDPEGTCRFFPGKAAGEYLMGRLAVRREYRGRGLGAELIAGAEREIRQKGGTAVVLHAQQQARAFYEKQGYSAYGDGDMEEGCPHVWMRKQLDKRM